MTVVELATALLLKPTVVMLPAFVITRQMRRIGAASRHAVWAGAIGAILALPLLATVVPAIRLDALDETVWRAAATPDSGAAGESFSPSESSPPTAKTRGFPMDDFGAMANRLGMYPFVIWGLVALALLARRLVSEWRVYCLARAARAATGRLARLAESVARRYGGQPERIFVSEAVRSPAVVGVLTPVLLFPEAAEYWSDADTEAVLIHELGHVQRRDCLLNLCADLAATVYWCNPLVAYATRRMRLEAERSCDERVVSAGTDSHAYAELLVRVAGADRSPLTQSAAATAMSRSRELESRIIALLDHVVPPPPVSPPMMVLLVAVGVAITLPSAALTLSAADLTLAQPLTQEPDRIGDFLAQPASERVPMRSQDADIDVRIAEALSGTDSALAKVLVLGLGHTPTHAADLVRERALWALSRATNGRLIEPLLQSLDDFDWRVQAYAAWTLGLVGEKRAVPRLISLLRHPVWRLRAMAAYALRETRDPRALQAMQAALADPAWQVRSEAVEYLAMLGGPAADSIIRARLNDRHVAVRRAAQRALRIP